MKIGKLQFIFLLIRYVQIVFSGREERRLSLLRIDDLPKHKVLYTYRKFILLLMSSIVFFYNSYKTVTRALIGGVYIHIFVFYPINFVRNQP